MHHNHFDLKLVRAVAINLLAALMLASGTSEPPVYEGKMDTAAVLGDRRKVWHFSRSMNVSETLMRGAPILLRNTADERSAGKTWLPPFIRHMAEREWKSEIRRRLPGNLRRSVYRSEPPQLSG